MLQNNSLIVSLSMSMWTARKLDKKITDEVRTNHNASDDAGRYNKLLVAKEHTDPITKVASEARQFHYDNTLSWGDNNERLLPTKNYFEYVKEMNQLEAKYNEAVSRFLGNYDAVIAQARIRLNGMFREADYPSRTEIERKFGFKITFMPVPSDDIRVGLQDETVAALRKKVEDEINNRLSGAVTDIYDRIKDQLQKMRDRLADTQAIFRDSLFENLNELVDLVPRLNVTDDPTITAICDDMRSLMVDPQSVRDNVKLRITKAEEVDAMLEKYKSMFN